MKAEQTAPITRNAQDTHEPRELLCPPRDLVEYFRQYTREKPEVVALVCIGIGIVLGWKLKPW
jgi:hypothetical protein